MQRSGSNSVFIGTRAIKALPHLLFVLSCLCPMAFAGPNDFPNQLRPETGTVEERCSILRLYCTYTLDYTDFKGNVIPGSTQHSGQILGGTPFTFKNIPQIFNLIDVRDVRQTTVNGPLADPPDPSSLQSSAGGDISDLSIEAVVFDTGSNQYFLENIFALLVSRIGVGASVDIPDLFADTNGDNSVGAGDVLYSLVDLAVFLNSVPAFEIGDTFNIVNGTVASLAGMMFSSTPFSFDANSGFSSGTPFSGAAQAGAFHRIASVPEPSSLLLLVTSVFALLGVGARKGVRRLLPKANPNYFQ